MSLYECTSYMHICIIQLYNNLIKRIRHLFSSMKSLNKNFVLFSSENYCHLFPICKFTFRRLFKNKCVTFAHIFYKLFIF